MDLELDPLALMDSWLMARVRAGDLAAETELYQAHSSAAVRRAMQYGAQPADAEDYMHEAFVRVIRQLRKGKGPDRAFRPYLIAAVRNVAADAHRGQRGREVPSPDAVFATEPVTAAADPQEQVEVRSSVQHAMCGLPQRWKDILWRLDVEGQTPASIADEIGVTPQSISALAYRARKAFRLAYATAHLPEAVAS
jgi:RNA polymerase sigma factor (sigma-70 family)